MNWKRTAKYKRCSRIFLYGLLLLIIILPKDISASDLPIVLPAGTQSEIGMPSELSEISEEAQQANPSFELSEETPHTHHLPIDINAIGRGEQPEIILSLRFFELDLFSANSRRINEAIAEQMRLNREALEGNLFESFELALIADINEQIAYAAAGLNLFAEPVSFGRIGQIDADDEIPLWIIISVLLVCAVLGFVIPRVVLSRKEDKAKDV